MRWNAECGIRAYKFEKTIKGKSQPYFRYKIQDFRTNKITWFTIEADKAPKVWQYYNTHERILSPKIALDPKLAKAMKAQIAQYEINYKHDKNVEGGVDMEGIQLEGEKP